MHLWLWKFSFWKQKRNLLFIALLTNLGCFTSNLYSKLIKYGETWGWTRPLIYSSVFVKIEILPRTPLQRRTWVTCLLVWRSWDVQRTTACSENLVNLSTSWRTWYKCPPPRTIKWTQPEAQMTPGLDLWLAPPPWFHLWSAPAWGNNNHDNRSIFKWITMNCSFIDIILGSVSGMCNL